MTLVAPCPPTTRRIPRLLIALVTAGLLVVGSACAQESSSVTGASTDGTRTVTDMEGRTVELPAKVERVVTLGSVPVINSFMFALGKGDLIVDGLPDFATRDDRWSYQYVFAPQIRNLPTMQTSDYSPRAEQLVNAHPDVVLTMMPGHVEPLAKLGVETIVLRWQDDEDVKQVVTLLGDVLGVPERAREYTDTFDSIVAEVEETVKDVPESQRLRALSLDPKAMTQPHTISQWWIAKGGGKPVTEGNTVEILKFNAEQVVTWDPEVIFVNDRPSVDAVLNDPKLAPVSAVKNNKVYNMPIAAHTWGNRTSEQPLSAAIAASKMGRSPNSTTSGLRC